MGVLSESRVTWPPVMATLLKLLAPFTLDWSVVAPECTFPGLTFVSRWVLTQAAPLVLAAVMVLAVTGQWVIVKLFRPSRERSVKRDAVAMSAAVFAVMYYAYLTLARNTFAVFDCAPPYPADGHTYMAGVFERCWEEGGVHMELVPWAVVCLVLYCIAFPVGVAVLLWRHREAIQADILERESGSRSTSVSASLIACRRRYERMYARFNARHYWWELAVLARKFLVAMATLLFRRNPMYQTGVVLLVLFVSYVVHVRCQPYASVPATRISWIPRFVRSANVTESLLLGSAVLVTLAGLLFEGREMLGDFYDTQRSIVTGLTFTLLLASLCYVILQGALEAGFLYRSQYTLPKKRSSAATGGGVELKRDSISINPMRAPRDVPATKQKKKKKGKRFSTPLRTLGTKKVKDKRLSTRAVL
jgi:hypothetical protein